MLRRQQCEADTLWAMQCMDLPLLGTHKAQPNHKYKVTLTHTHNRHNIRRPDD
jgi:hypothetical protein